MQKSIRKNGTIRIQTINDLPSKTDTQFKDDVDVNYIIDRFSKTGQLTHTNHQNMTYQDLSELEDLPTTLNLINKTKEQFHKLPAEKRKLFDNNPNTYVEFLSNPSNAETLQKIGLSPEKKENKGEPDVSRSTESKPDKKDN